jgi:hypothetical protein
VTIPRFFARVHAAVGRHLAVDSATLAKRLDNVSVAVQCGRAPAQSAAWINELLVNQLARLYPRLCLCGDDTTCDGLGQIALAINPQIELSNDPAKSTVLVSTTGGAPDKALVVGAHGWSAILGDSDVAGSATEPNPFAAGAAAALAASAVFRRILLNDESAWGPTALDLMSFGSDAPSTRALRPLDLGQLLVAGVGAVGNAAIWALSRHPHITGHALVIDPEDVELSNLQRYVLTTDNDVGRAKTELAKLALSRTGLDIEVVRGRLGEIDVPRDIKNTIVTVDNVRGRRVAQALLPRLVVSGWTSESGLGCSWHDFQNGAACLSCMYYPSGPAPSQTEIVAAALGLTHERAALLWVTSEGVNARDVETIANHLGADSAELAPWIGKPLQQVYTRLVCGSAAVSVAERGRVEAVPLAHQSVLAGVLAAAELVKRVDPTLSTKLPPHTLAAWHDVTRSPPKLWLQRRAQEKGCICGDPDYREVFEAKWSDHLP